ncbi:MFS transporter [Paenibacillus sp. MER 99-2]|uniref:MFS transporter n=1 Tax=Paenibacillus sp. MER 99-2 TaxID=2939572 RepID=UPI00203E365E|nr:MFS transporter [Paenibacillus sp. MER 99-2]
MDIRRNLVLLMLICFLSQMGGFMIIPLFPLFIEEFGMSGWMMGIIFALFYVGKVLGGIPAAAVYRKLGGKKALILMLLMLAVCMAGFAVSSTALLFGVLRLLQGVASTGLTVVVRSIIGDEGNVSNRGLYNGYISSSEGGGMVLGPVISGWLALHWPLSVPFWLVTLCCLMAMGTAWGMKGRSTTNLGIQATQDLNTHNPSSPTTDTPPIPTGATAFINPDLDQSNLPDTDNPALSQRQQFIGYATVHFLEMSAYAVFLTYFALYAAHIMQWNPLQTSLAFTVAGLSTLAAAPFAGYLSDRMGDRLLLCMLGMLMIGIEVIVFLSTASYLWVYVGMLIGGVGGACYMDSFFAHVGDHIPEKNRSNVIGKIVSAAEIGSIVSPIIAALLAEYSSLYAVFVFNLLLIAAAIAVQAVMRSRYRVHQR